MKRALIHTTLVAFCLLGGHLQGAFAQILTNDWNVCVGKMGGYVVVPEQFCQDPIVASAGPDRYLICTATSLTLTGSGPVGSEYSYDWTTPNGQISSGGNTLNPTVTTPGLYCLTVTNAQTGCSATDCMTVFANAPLNLQAPELFCEGATSANLTLAWNFLMPPYTLHLAYNGTFLSPIVATSNPFTITVPSSVTDVEAWVEFGNGCTSVVVHHQFGQSTASADILLETNDCDSDSLTASLSGSFTPPLYYNWSTGGQSVKIAAPLPSTYSVTVLDQNGCIWTASETVLPTSTGTCATISGAVARDTDVNCLVGAGEERLSDWLVMAEGLHTYYGTTDENGNYSIPVEPGSYLVRLIAPNQFWAACPSAVLAQVPSSGDAQIIDFSVVDAPGCPIMNLDVATYSMRRCADNYFFVHYANEGTETATHAYLMLQLDNRLDITSTSVPFTDLGNHLYRFDLPDLPPNSQNSFHFSAFLDCGAKLGAAICTEARIFPDTSCTPTSPLWSGASLDVDVVCGDSVRFMVVNNGNAPSTGLGGYVVIEDAVMYKIGEVGTILPGESLEILLPANGSTWQMEVQQEQGHPLPSQPIAFLEGCGLNSSGEISTGFVNQYPLGDPEPWSDNDCREVTGPYDPNDKNGYPLGLTEEHLVGQNGEFEYLIRFQNTGNDTAYEVVIRDTLSSFLDLTGLRPGASSHVYDYEIYGQGILQFTFRDIMLPDSNVNEPGSHGFISFRVPQKNNLSPGTLIANRAGIYFDFNDPIVTNTSLHMVDKPKQYAFDNVEVCHGEVWNGLNLQSDTTFLALFSNAEKDSVVQYSVQVLPTAFSSSSATICEGEVFSFNGKPVGDEGEYTAVLTAANGCDSTATLQLTVLPNAQQTIDTSTCDGLPFIFNEEIYANSGMYETVVENPGGCPTFLSIYLEVTPPIPATEVEMEVVEGSIFNGVLVQNDTMLTAVLEAVNGCDSMVVYHIVALPNHTSDWAKQLEFKAFPNPSSGEFQVRFLLPTSCTASLKIVDLVGRQVEVLPETHFPTGVNSVKINLRDWASGVYFLQFNSSLGQLVRMVMKE